MRTIAADRRINKIPFHPAPGSGTDNFRIDRYQHDASYLRDELLIPHRKDYYFFAYVKEGCNRHWVDTTAYQVKPQTFYINNPQQVIVKEDTAPITAVALSFTPEFLAMDPQLLRMACIVNKQEVHEIPLQPAEAALVEDLLDRLYEEFSEPRPLQQQMLLAYMKSIFVVLSRVYTRLFGEMKQSEERGIVCRFLTRIDEHYAHLHEVAGYASLMNISAGYLGELIKQETGRSAIALIHDRLMLEAKRLLVHTDQSVKEISFALGFEDDSYFVRFFKRGHGCTPAVYRSRIREMYH